MLKIKVQESIDNEPLDSFESLSSLLQRINEPLSSRDSKYSLWACVRDIKHGATDTYYGSAEDIKNNILRKKELIQEAFDEFLANLDTYI